MGINADMRANNANNLIGIGEEENKKVD